MTTAQKLEAGGITLALFVGIPAIFAVVRQHPERRTILHLAPLSALSP